MRHDKARDKRCETKAKSQKPINTTRQDETTKKKQETIQDKTRPDITRYEKTRQCKTQDHDLNRDKAHNHLWDKKTIKHSYTGTPERNTVTVTGQREAEEHK